MEQLGLGISGRVRCRCGKEPQGPWWEVRESDGSVSKVCAVCVREYPNGRRRQCPVET